MAAAFAATTVLPVSDRRFSADRWKDNERHAAGQRAKQQRMADYARPPRRKRRTRIRKHGNVPPLRLSAMTHEN
jgi:hypothetical protein